jgi:hypothetical protein
MIDPVGVFTASPALTEDERGKVLGLIERLVRECPERRPTSEGERRAQRIVQESFKALGLRTEFHPFEFNDNLYSNLALHFGLGTLGTAVSGIFPLAGLALHLAAGSSFLLDATRKAYLLRRLLGFKPSQNLLATLPADGEPSLRIVIAAHADAAFTGLMFDPRAVRAIAARRMPGPLERALAFATWSNLALAGVDLARLFLGPLTWPLRPLEAALTAPSAIIAALGLQVVLRNELVPGANDDLSGVAALPLLAARLAGKKRKDVELVFATTGCEEASMGGADALARDKEGVWDKRRTVFLALDSLTNGDLCYLESEGDVLSYPIPDWLQRTFQRVAASEPRFAKVKGHRTPVGGTDAAAFLARGWDAGALLCIDPELGSPRHYHTPSDTPENLEIETLFEAIEFVEKVVGAVVETRLGGPLS